MPRTVPVDADYGTLADFRYHLRRFLRVREEAAKSAGVEPQQYQLLLEVKAFEARKLAPTIGELAERLQIQHHSAVGLIDRMARRELVARRQVSTDQRRVLIVLRPRGRAIVKTLAVQSLAELRSEAPALLAFLKQLQRRAGR